MNPSTSTLAFEEAIRLWENSNGLILTGGQRQSFPKKVAPLLEFDLHWAEMGISGTDRRRAQ
jgi:hypothetical protein